MDFGGEAAAGAVFRDNHRLIYDYLVVGVVRVVKLRGNVENPLILATGGCCHNHIKKDITLYPGYFPEEGGQQPQIFSDTPLHNLF